MISMVLQRLSTFATSCAEQLWARDDPIDSNELAAKYNCTIGKLPATPGYKDGKEVISK